MSIRLRTALTLCVAAALTACGTSEPVQQQVKSRADYSVFTDSTWLPEEAIRAPYGSVELQFPIVMALTEGVHAFYGTEESHFKIQSTSNGVFKVQEKVTKHFEKPLSWSTGASTLYRNGLPVTEWGDAQARTLHDGRLLVSIKGAANVNYAVKMTAFNVSGKPVRQLLRDANNQPDALAWFVRKDAVFPTGSIAYVFTYWLGDDEIVQPAVGTVTGAATLEQLITTYTEQQPYCLSYLDHDDAHPYGFLFDTQEPVWKFWKKFKKNKAPDETKPAKSGKFILVDSDRDAFFCKRSASKKTIPGKWRVRDIQGTRVLEITRPSSVSSSDFGIQPVNRNSVNIGFAEVFPRHSTNSKMRVVPVRILKDNKPIVDFRVRFNPIAARVVREALIDASKSKVRYEQQEKGKKDAR